MKGTVIKSTGSWYIVASDEPGAKRWQCRIVGKFRLENLPLTNPIAVGDRVEITPEGDEGHALIKTILPRTNYVARQSPRRKHDLHLLAANVDQAMVAVTISHPMLKPGFIDRFLVMTEKFEIPVCIVFNKADLYSDEDLELFLQMRDVYQKINYRVLLCSALTGDGLDALKRELQDKTTLLSGQSGVGKSTLINAIQPQLVLRTGEISDYSGKGQHTTTFAEMFDLDFGGRLIDTPGIKTLAFNNKSPENIAHSFREMFAYSTHCRFGGSCLHREEPGCAVREALRQGDISPWRYANYLAILDEIQQQNHWDRIKDY